MKKLILCFGMISLHLSILSAVATEPKGSEDKSLHVVVTGKPLKGFHCKFGPENFPPQVKNEHVRFRVGVTGAQGPFKWRLPLYQSMNGITQLGVSRVGKATLDSDKTFAVDINVADLEKVRDQKDFTLEVSSVDGKFSTCTTSAAPILEVARAVPVRELLIVNGSVGQ